MSDLEQMERDALIELVAVLELKNEKLAAIIDDLCALTKGILEHLPQQVPLTVRAREVMERLSLTVAQPGGRA